MADMLYFFTSCAGSFYGLTDEQGYTPTFLTPRQCEHKVYFMGCRGTMTCTAKDVEAAIARQAAADAKR
ncbi:hypothetical protein C9I28_08280 [Pseudoduganella armeniaca]|uniref:Uncharacterized protein n=1 Tax=Pseudoduganella armeniaca TaxID=2072590 RepID=A0A2R4C7X7_9BURK|nr:hypothetical protein C9I28_08280 [Pseudoduganella armeniaca]